MEVELIGGPCDGLTVNITEGARRIQVPIANDRISINGHGEVRWYFDAVTYEVGEGGKAYLEHDNGPTR